MVSSLEAAPWNGGRRMILLVLSSYSVDTAVAFFSPARPSCCHHHDVHQLAQENVVPSAPTSFASVHVGATMPYLVVPPILFATTNDERISARTTVNTSLNRLNRWKCDILKSLRRLTRRKRLPQTKNGMSSNNNRTLQQQATQFLIKFTSETCLVGIILTIIHGIASLEKCKLLSIISSHNRLTFFITNLTRWIAASLTIRFIRLHSKILASVPSLAREENDDWFLKGSFRLLSNACDAANPSKNSIPVQIRQVPGNGSCLFHAIAACVLHHNSLMSLGPNASKSNANINKTEKNANKLCMSQKAHPPMSKVLALSSELRKRAVDFLRQEIENKTALLLQNDELIPASILVETAAEQYGLTAKEYLNDMCQEGVWGGGPEITALANSMERQIILLEPVDRSTMHEDGGTAVNENDSGCNLSTIYLRTMAKFGPMSDSNLSDCNEPIYILSANQKFPCGYGQMDKKNHFLAVFPNSLLFHKGVN